MPAALPTIIRRIQDQEDAPTLGAGQNGQALVWNNATGLFETAAISGLSINDSTTSLSSVWSSSKTDTEIGLVDTELTAHTSDLTLHRVINDSSTASTVLWSASKINTELASKGVGDFLADGSVAMTGTLNLAGSGITSDDSGADFTLGRVYIGEAGVGNAATFAHRDFANTTDYGFRQNSAGLIVFNAPSAQAMHFRLGGSTTYMSLNSSGLSLIHISEPTRQVLVSRMPSSA